MSLKNPKITAKLSFGQVIQAVQEDENSGFCISCGVQAFSVESDARAYPCESCGQPDVYGADE